MSIFQQLVQHSQPHWTQYIQHDFVQGIATGTLPKAAFQHYLKQDYRYLFQYSRALSLGIFKADNFAQMAQANEAISILLKEINVHLQFCQQWGIAESEVFATEESFACIAYTRYVLDCGINGGLAELYAALLPCAAGYAEIGRWIKNSGISAENNPYQAWIDAYAADDFQAGVQKMIYLFESVCCQLNEKQLQNLQTIFTTATKMEIAFWQMGLDLTL
ncbi:thiaminase/transcriptional activator TenA [Nicoletella semolina]|uniref:Aminopyrimidine aminohydrolase n=1 Tax=Nicoletella semolina TaxID=271160 RepID=A0A4R2N9E6_9PAST|nr:thiaminase II [Nicoletella semolina]MDH2923787.1 thiaminase II [Nicoletella semolina]MDH2925559.1 thiaminase II [Nicoletella semolina]TCP17623.1 thiaminase/transcriptional activator TenA [Nicoletella semolina]